jgi:hypothetical protein
VIEVYCVSARSELPHSLWKDEEPEVCLFVKDREGEGQKAAKKRLAEVCHH